MIFPCKPHPIVNEYHSIEDRDEGNSVMYRIKIHEGKGHPKDADGKWAFPSRFEGENPNTRRKYTKISSLICDMIVPIHGMGEIVPMDSGFCVTVVILHLHKHGVYGKSLVKKQKYLPKRCPGAQIYSYMEGNPLGCFKTLMQDMGGVPFNIHFTRDDRFVTKLMRTHGILDKVPNQSTYRQKNGE